MKITTTRSLLVAIIATGLALSGRTATDGFLRAETIAQTPAPQVDEIAVALRNPGSHQRVGLPDFVWASGAPEMAEHARTVAEVLWADLDFEREFYMIRRTESARIPAAPADALPYDQWAQLGADFVLAGNARANGQNLVIELRLMHVKGDQRGGQYFGRRYQCGMQTARGARDCAHQIADDFHKEVRQVDGVARTKLAFSSDRDSGRVAGRPNQQPGVSKEIYLSDYDGANQVRLTTNASINISPTWSPDGRRVAYTSYASGFPDVYIANLAQPGRGLLRPAQGSVTVHNQFYAWSPDGRQVAFTSNRGGNYDIWLMNEDGSGLRNLTNTPRADEGTATWSPNGQSIAFWSDRAGVPQLYIQNVSSPNAQRVMADRIDRPTWSTMNFIAFTIGSSPFYDIGIWDFNDPGVKILTPGGVGTNESPAVSPNGRHIAFITTRWGRQEIATMDRTGENVRRITQVGNNTYPNWQPIPGR